MIILSTMEISLSINCIKVADLTRWHGEIRLNFAPAGSGLMIATAATMTSGGLLWIQFWPFSDFTSCCAWCSTHSFHTEIFLWWSSTILLRTCTIENLRSLTDYNVRVCLGVLQAAFHTNFFLAFGTSCFSQVWAQCTVVELSSYPNRTTVAVRSPEHSLALVLFSNLVNLAMWTGWNSTNPRPSTFSTVLHKCGPWAPQAALSVFEIVALLIWWVSQPRTGAAAVLRTTGLHCQISVFYLGLSSEECKPVVCLPKSNRLPN